MLSRRGVFALKKRERDRGDSPRKGRRGRGGVIPPNIKMKGKATTSIRNHFSSSSLLLYFTLLSQRIKMWLVAGGLVAWLVGDQ